MFSLRVVVYFRAKLSIFFGKSAESILKYQKNACVGAKLLLLLYADVSLQVKSDYA
jgi:hypothetical protein